MTPHEINTKYPIRNPVWSFDKMTGRWMTEASNLKDNLDPWKRPTPPAVRRIFDAKEKEIVGWIHHTSVEGNQIELVVYND